MNPDTPEEQELQARMALLEERIQALTARLEVLENRGQAKAQAPVLPTVSPRSATAREAVPPPLDVRASAPPTAPGCDATIVVSQTVCSCRSNARMYGDGQMAGSR